VNATEQRPIELGFWQHTAIFAVACVLLITRRPDAIFHAQFWAEDGHAWFADAYNFGWWTAMFRTGDGYFQTLPRFAASLALLAPLSLAPLVLNLIAIAVQALPANLLLSPRSSAWGSLRFRILLACVYLVLPNTREMDAIVTNSQWVLSLSAFLTLVASAPKGFAGRRFSIAFLLLCGLTGPFCAFLLPVALFLAWRRRDSWRRLQAGVLVMCCLIQAWGLLIVNPSGRSHYSALGASPELFARLLAGQVYLGTLLGSNGLDAIPGRRILILFIFVAIAGTAIIAVCFVKSAIEMKLLLIFSAFLLAASLISPNCSPSNGVSSWEMLAGAGGIRYWFFPTLAFAWSLLWCFRSRLLLLRIVSAPLLLLMCFGIVRDWEHPAFPDLHFAEDAERIESVPVGMAVTIPENPQGWTIRLVKRPSAR
jgi:hypothetical protein